MDFDFKNVMETVVFQKMDEMLPTMQCCQCPRCRADIAAIALNRLPAKYAVTVRGELISKAESYSFQNSTDVIAAITEAVGVVSQRPRHEETKD